MRRKGNLTRAMAAGVLGLAGVAGLPAVAQTVGDLGPLNGTGTAMRGGTITSITVRGNQRVETPTVLAYITQRPGQAFSQQRVDESIKRLFATGLFSDVMMARDGNTLVVEVRENPMVNRIAFEGNRRVDDDTMAEEIELRPRNIFSRSRVQADAQRLERIYRRSGRYSARVTPKLIELPENRVDLVYEVDEGPKTDIQRVDFVGNKQFSDHALRGVVATKEAAWYRFLTSTDSYDPDRLEYDRELLRRYYLGQGYADFRVLSSTAELSRNREDFYVTFTVEEGDRYQFGNVDVQSALPEVNANTLLGLVTTRPGAWYDAKAVENTVEFLTDAAANQGYAFAEVRPEVVRNRATKTIDIIYRVVEGPRVYVDRININGNVRTLDRVIRREMELVEGDAFNRARLEQSERNIKDLGFFQDVTVDFRPSPTAPDRGLLDVEVEEASTGELTLGLGWSTVDGAAFQVGLQERNFMGRGQVAGLSLGLSERANSINFSFTEPYFLGRHMAAGTDVFLTKTDFQDEASYDEERYGFTLRLGYDLSRHWSESWRYTLARETVSNVPADASIYVKDAEGTNTVSAVGHSLIYDTRDSKLEPTDGLLGIWSIDIAGLGGTVHYVRNQIFLREYYPLKPGWVLALGGQVGYITGLGEDTRLADRFYLGGPTLRGFQAAGVSPRDAATDDALGANWQYSGTAEVRTPLPVPDELGLSGRLYTDFGSSGGVDGVPSNAILESRSVRWSAGAGLVWRSPMGPFTIGFALPILKEDYDQLETLNIQFGTSF